MQNTPTADLLRDRADELAGQLADYHAGNGYGTINPLTVEAEIARLQEEADELDEIEEFPGDYD